MKHGLRTFLLITIIMSLAVSGFALVSTLTLKGGVARDASDIEDEKQINGMLGLSYEIWMANWISLGINPYLTKLQAGAEEDAINFKSNIVGGDLLLKIRPHWKPIAPFIYGGAGVVNFYPKDLADNPLGGDPDSAYPYTTLAAPVAGAGFSILTGTGIDFDLGVQYQMLNTDYLESWKDGDTDDAIWMAYLGISHTFGQKNIAEPVVQEAEEIKFKPTLTVGRDLFNVSSEQGVAGASILSNTDWTITSDAEWLRVYPTSGSGNQSFDISYDDNQAYFDRTGTVTITGSGLTQTITVLQKAGMDEPKLFVEERTRYVTSEAGSIDYQIIANVAWKVSEDVEWLSISPLSGSNDGVLNIKYDANPTRKARSGQVVIESQDLNQTLTIIQERIKPGTIVKDKPLILEGVHFKSGSSSIEKESYDTLDEMVETLKYYPEMIVEIQGYTDSTGSLEINRKLSQARAEAVREYLINKGIAASRMTAKGYGPENPIASNSTPEGRAQNRRIEFVRMD
ncbi:MAG: OmpA family protein [Candidatus Cloacimonadaceae bacterium]